MEDPSWVELDWHDTAYCVQMIQQYLSINETTEIRLGRAMIGDCSSH